MLMRPKHSLDRLLTLRASGGHDLMGGITAQLRKKCVSFSNQCLERIWARLSDLSQGLSASEPA
jgi:hypothetical protein